MKAVIPLAGKGTRLRPHTHLVPKPLVNVAGQPVMGYILEELIALGITEMVFIVGYLGDVIRSWMAEHYPQLSVHYVVQEVQDGTAGAIKLAEPFADDELLILFVDTLFEADLTLSQSMGPEWAGVIWAKEVDDYHRYGVVVTDDDSAMTTIVEKPTQPISRLANIGLYYIRDYALLFEGINHTLTSEPGPSGEFYLTDAFQYMVNHGAWIFTAPVEGWYDCGKPEGLLVTNRHLLESGRGEVAQSAGVDMASTISEPIRIEYGVVIENSTVGPNVTLERGARVVNSEITDAIVGPGTVIEDSRLHDSIIGAHADIRGFRGQLSVADHSVIGE